MLDALLASRAGVEQALTHDDGTYLFADVVQGVLANRMQFWKKDDTFVVTEVVNFPQRRVIRVFLAAGKQETLRAMEPAMEAWAVEQGCTEAVLLGRKGWARSYLRETGWCPSDLVLLKKTLRGGA